MNARERILAIGLGSVLVLWFGWGIIQARIIEPLAAQDRQIITLQTQLTERLAQLDAARQAAVEVGNWQRLSLPGDVSDAQALYLESLRQMLSDAGIDRPTIRPSRPINRADVYSRLPVTVEARADLDQLTKFLTAFYDTPLMQQIRRLRVQPLLKEGKIEGYDFSLSVEALSMPDAFATDALPAPEEVEVALADRPERKADEFAVFASKNLFQPTEWVDKSAKATDESEEKRGEKDQRDDYFVTATLSANGINEAWFTNRSDNTRKVVKEGEQLDIPGMTATVLKILPGVVMLQVGEKIGSVDINHNLASWEGTTTPATTDETAHQPVESEEQTPPETADRDST